ncbi:hypothetical protein KP509_32G056500 [Ceratopteris richardii]|uniref:Auxin response factor n=1 Tax=Ceratopteris richardii TaxID=49495 RepID=A0A8T2QV28_CERRI|nr:hypothetical protein KP509_32G056500 [Ceratopteris richardii]
MAETSGGLPLRSAAADPELWHACAAAVSHLPEVGSFVVYFPQGHAEQVLPSPSLHDLPPVAPACIPCKITSVEYLADFETDEAYARMCLQPLPNLDLSDVHNEDCSESSSFRQREKLVSFAKTLTQSDANNGGGFSIPRYCADTIFPPLDYTQNPPVQMILAKDIHGRLWKFRHIYRGTPRRHLLTTGWSNFVNQKKLVAGDVIVFVRNSDGQLCVGIRRATRGLRHASVPSQFGLQESADQRSLLQQELHLGIRAGDNAPKFSRHRNTLVTMQSVVEAAVAASSGNPFEILYYPRASASEFCVNLSTVKKALQVTWVSGMRFKMALETEDASRTNWYMGTVLKLGELDPIRWPKSPWKILQSFCFR